MKDTFKFSCVIDTTDASCILGMEIWLDGAQIFNEIHIQQRLNFHYDIPDNDSTHTLKFVIKGKTIDHTKIDEQGNILSDARLIVEKICFEDIELGNMLSNFATYTHDYNGTAQPTTQTFYRELGCNGMVELSFSSPVYLWLLENM
jgi:hypothetical protein